MPPTSLDSSKVIPEKKVESSTDQIQQTNQLENQVIEDQIQTKDERDTYIANLEQRIAEQQIQSRRLEGLLEGLSKREERPETKQTRNVEEERKRFYTDPAGTLDERDNRILKQMEEMLKPLKEVASSFKSNDEYTRVKNVVKSDPVYGKGLKDPEIENIVDSWMKASGVEINEDNIKSAIAQAAGVKSLRGGGNIIQNNNTNTRIDPPQVSTTRTRSTVSESPKKELTEDDRLAMKIAGLKPGNPEHEAEYWNLVNDETMTLSVHKKGS